MCTYIYTYTYILIYIYIYQVGSFPVIAVALQCRDLFARPSGTLAKYHSHMLVLDVNSTPTKAFHAAILQVDACGTAIDTNLCVRGQGYCWGYCRFTIFYCWGGSYVLLLLFLSREQCYVWRPLLLNRASGGLLLTQVQTQLVQWTVDETRTRAPSCQCERHAATGSRARLNICTWRL